MISLLAIIAAIIFIMGAIAAWEKEAARAPHEPPTCDICGVDRATLRTIPGDILLCLKCGIRENFHPTELLENSR